MLTPEHSIQIQNTIGADIIMQLDDVVKSTINGPRVKEATHRYIIISCFDTYKHNKLNNTLLFHMIYLNHVLPLSDATNHSRTIRWLDRCLSAHERPSEQSIFPIVQGGLDPALRSQCARELTKREVNGYAVGGLR